MKCDCGQSIPEIISVMTQPNPSGLDVTAFGVMLECLQCKQRNLIVFKPIAAFSWNERDPFPLPPTGEKPS